MAKKQDESDPDMKDSDVAPSPFDDGTTDPMPHNVAVALEPFEAKVKAGILSAMVGATDELHAIQKRLEEMVPFLPGAIEKATGDVKGFLQVLTKYL